MSAPTPPLLQRLEEFLEKNPRDSFTRYGLAMELAKLGRAEEALAHFRRIMAEDPDYVPAHHQAGLMLARAGRKDEAREALRSGVEAARRRGDARRAAEIQGTLDDLDLL